MAAKIVRMLTGIALQTLILVPQVGADEATAAEVLALALSSQDTLRGRFEQIHNDPQGRELERSSGQFTLLRPGYLRWEIAEPDPQLLVSDLEYLWHYDIELATATRRLLDDTVRLSPGQLLSGDPAAMTRNYDIVRVSTTVGGEHYILRPRSELRADAGFASMEVHLDGDLVRAMSVISAAGATTEILFSDLVPAPELSPRDFVFLPPAGADVFYHD
jgi:outer membrane lipoprotein carrier protein